MIYESSVEHLEEKKSAKWFILDNSEYSLGC